MSEESSTVRESDFRHHLVAGSFAGVAEHVSVFPLDTVKTHLQAQVHGGSSGSAAGTRVTSGILGDLAVARDIIAQHGGSRLWRGVSVTGVMCGPAHALMFAAYEQIIRIGETRDGQASAERTAVVGAIAGGVSTFLHDGVMVPADVIKQRMQLGFYRSGWHCLERMLSTGGGSLYRSLPTTLAMNVPFSALMMSLNESIRKVLNPSGKHSLSTYLISGGIAGAVAGALTTPLDVVKTKLQTQGLGELQAHAAGAAPSAPSNFAVRYPGFVAAASAIAREEGYRGFARGAGPRMLMFGSSCAISWAAYEGDEGFDLALVRAQEERRNRR